MYYINSYKVLILKSHCYTIYSNSYYDSNPQHADSKLLGDNPYYGMFRLNRHCMEYSADRVGTSSGSLVSEYQYGIVC